MFVLASQVALVVENLHANAGYIRDPGWISWRRALAAHSSILLWRIPWIEELEGYIPLGHEEWGKIKVT